MIVCVFVVRRFISPDENYDTKMLWISSLMSSSVKLLQNVIQLDLLVSAVCFLICGWSLIRAVPASLRNITIHSIYEILCARKNEKILIQTPSLMAVFFSQRMKSIEIHYLECIHKRTFTTMQGSKGPSAMQELQEPILG